MPSPTPAKPSLPRSRRRRLLWAKLLLAMGSLVLMLWASDRVIGSFNFFGVRYGEESQRYRQELTDLVFTRPDGSLDLDGELFRHRPSARSEFHDFSVSINSLGFRGPEVDRAKPDGVYRILALGDSVTFGWGIDDEHGFVRRLESDLNQQLATPARRFEVINGGHPMYDTVQEAAQLERVERQLDPDLVILTYVINDIDPSRDVVEAYLAAGKKAVEDAAAGKPGAEAAAEPFLVRHLPSLSRLYQYCSARLAAPAGEADREYMQKFLADRQEGWDRSAAALLKIRDLCQARGIPLLVLDHTHPPIAELPVFCQAKGIPCYDLKFSDAERALPIYNSLLDSHSNRRGNEILLGKVKRCLREAGLFDLR